MILVDCTSCHRRELRDVRSVTVTNTHAGIELAWTCRSCGRAHVDYVGKLAAKTQHQRPPRPQPLVPAA